MIRRSQRFFFGGVLSGRIGTPVARHTSIHRNTETHIKENIGIIQTCLSHEVPLSGDLET